ncbi:MAG: peptidoglycan DD-metalloendopeptidase family protein [Treponema sp.]|nr:peptidoglycan DD-metalloendopeptidase family protein [Treponema sp.]
MKNQLTVVKTEDCVRIETPNFRSTFSMKDKEEAKKTDLENDVWRQYQKDIELYNKIKNSPPNYKKNLEHPKALFYIYKVKEDKEKYLTNFNGLYARFQLKQSTLASINRLSNPDSIKVGQELILSIRQGIFIPKKAESTLETLLQKEFAPYINDNTASYEINGTIFYFIPDMNFSPTLIAFFHDKGMQLPLSKKIITSDFGYRTSPISGTWKFHAGIDLAAPIGTEVFACKHGSVATVGFNEIYGNYIDIKHNGNTVSRYAHLSKTLVKKGQQVATGEVIGLVGTTGASTGPHLHFEVRENGTPKDPKSMIDKL